MEITLKRPQGVTKNRMLTGLLLALYLVPASANQPLNGDSELLPEARHEKIGQLVTEFIQKSHYQHAAVDDALSSKVLDRYIEALDSNRMYFLASDVEAFDQFQDIKTSA